MEPAIVILLLIAAFVLARVFRSTKMWWSLVFAILAGLLVGILSKGITGPKKDSVKALTEVVSTANSNESSLCTQSLVATVTEGTTDCLSGVASYTNEDEELFDVLTMVNTGINGRDSPAIEDDS